MSDCSGWSGSLHPFPCRLENDLQPCYLQRLTSTCSQFFTLTTLMISNPSPAPFPHPNPRVVVHFSRRHRSRNAEVVCRWHRYGLIIIGGVHLRLLSFSLFGRWRGLDHGRFLRSPLWRRWGRVVADPGNRVWDLWVIEYFLDWTFKGGGYRSKQVEWMNGSR
jgi:hypothetical protein